MSKLSKVNKNGSLSVILPKAITGCLWQAGDEVNINALGQDAILIDKQEYEKWSIEEMFEKIEQAVQGQKEMMIIIKQTTSTGIKIKLDEAMLRSATRQLLLEMIRRI